MRGRAGAIESQCARCAFVQLSFNRQHPIGRSAFSVLCFFRIICPAISTHFQWTLHDLRRTFATNCAKLGIPIHITELILNHRTGTISGIVRVYNRYSYLDEMKDALLLHEKHIRKIVELGD